MSAVTPSSHASRWTALARRVPISGAILVVFLAIVAWITALNPNFIEPAVFMNFLRRSSPLVVLAVGQLFVVIAGGLDLSVGSIVTLTVVIAARMIDGNESLGLALVTMLVVAAAGAIVGLANGLVVTKLKVPSIVATLGMLLIVSGGVDYWSGGSPRGALSDAIRVLGRDGFHVPLVDRVPYAVVVVAVVAAVAGFVVHRSVFGKHLVAVGGGTRTALSSGIAVRRTRVLAFVISGFLAALGGILLTGIAGVSAQVGDGLEFRAITAVVLGGALIGGGRGSVLATVLGALTLDAVFTLLNLLGFSAGTRFTVQGVLIVLAVTVESVRRRERV